MHRRAEAERIDFFFSTTEWDGEPRNEEPEKCDELRWSPLAELPENTVPYVRHAFDAWRSGTRYVEFGWE